MDKVDLIPKDPVIRDQLVTVLAKMFEHWLESQDIDSETDLQERDSREWREQAKDKDSN